MFRRISLFWIAENRKAEDCVRTAMAFLSARGITVLTEDMIDSESAPELIITFGGDGTLLSGARLAIAYDIPLIGINLGTIGFLTEEEPGNLIPALEKILSGDYTIEERSLLEAVHTRTGTVTPALNDIVISRGGFARLIRVECKVDNEPYGLFVADGIIAATPTGSTGYSLSAGGPIVSPEMNCMIITPICPHSLQHCSGVISEKSVIQLILTSDRIQSAELQVDGRNIGSLQSGDEIVVRGTEKKIRLLRLYPYRFYSLIQKKLSEWGTSHD